MATHPKSFWKEIDFVLLDMDGTLLDKHFDDYFWEQFVPEQYAAQQKITPAEAKAFLMAAYKEHQGTLIWTDVHYWSERFGLDIVALKRVVAHRIAVHDGVIPFLQSLKGKVKKVALLTNAHPTSVTIKFEKTGIGAYFDCVVSADDTGYSKEAIGFWESAQVRVGFDKERSLFVDDSEETLLMARQFGIRHLLFKSYASSQIEREDSIHFPSIRNFSELLPT
jgi:putative hydrolase of the HAD superfamily